MPEKSIVTEIAVKNQQTSEYEYADIGSSADKITYDNSSSQLEGETVQAAIDEVNTKIGNKSTVSVTPTLVSGTQVGTISVNGTGVNLYAPTPIDVVANPSTSGELDNLQQITIGSISYNIPQGNSNVGELDDLNDVSISNPSSGDVLTYNGTEWHAAPAQGGGGSSTLSELEDVNLSSLVDGQVLKYDATNQEWINANESTGSTVVWNQIQGTGTKIATVSIDGTPTDVYAPTSGGGGGGATSLAGLDDVTVSSASNDQDLSYDSTSSKWINKTHRVELTKAEYDALPSSKLTDGIEYFITDMETTGVEIVANPEDTATDTLIKLQIGDDVYNIDGDGTDVVHLTQAQYDALPSSKLTDDKVYMITDVNGDSSQFQPVIYSEDEREIGVWTDGKPLYEKTVIFEGTFLGSTTIGNLNISNVDFLNIIMCSGHSVDNTYRTFSFAHSDASNNVGIFIKSNGDVEIRAGSSVTSEYAYNKIAITVRYTKTTDQSGSGTWTPQGVPAVHYSTDEQVVGTWIDGNTIYKKTFYNAGGVAQSLNITHGINNLDKCIKYEGTAYDSNDSSRVYVLPRIDYGSVDIGIDHIDSTNIVVGINNNFQTRIIDIYITIYYTKTQGGN